MITAAAAEGDLMLIVLCVSSPCVISAVSSPSCGFSQPETDREKARRLTDCSFPVSVSHGFRHSPAPLGDKKQS